MALVSRPYELIASILALAITLSMFFSRKKSWDPRGKQCVVTGGSSGLGFEYALLLVKKGAHVAIVGRDEKKLAKCLKELQAARVNDEQVITSHAFSLETMQASTEMLLEAIEPHKGRAPDAVFTCAGISTPGFALEMDEDALKKGMNDAYWIQAFPAMAAAKLMAKQAIKGKIVLVSSTLGYFGLVGYSSYAPGKHALRGLAECLRSELALYEIEVQIFFPCTIYSPGYENENRTKPAITLKIEESDDGLTTQQAANALFTGTQKGHAQFAGDLITNLFRVSTRGSAPNHNIFIDGALYLIAWPGIAIWRWITEAEIRKHRPVHLEEFAAKGLVATS